VKYIFLAEERSTPLCSTQFALNGSHLLGHYLDLNQCRTKFKKKITSSRTAV